MEKKFTIEELLESELDNKGFAKKVEEIAGIRKSVYDFLSERENIDREEIQRYGRCEMEFLEDDRLGINFRLKTPFIAPILAMGFFRDKNGEFYLKGWNVVKKCLPIEFKPEVEFHPFLKEAILRAHQYSRYIKDIISPEHLKAQKKAVALISKIPEREGREKRFTPYSWKGASLADSLGGFVESARQLIDDWRYSDNRECATSLELLVFGRTSPPMKRKDDKSE